MKPTARILQPRRARVRVAFLFLLSALSTAWTVTASATSPVHDHLECRRALDASESDARVDLETLPFGLDEGCVVEAKVREVCTPATAGVLAGGSSRASSDASAGESSDDAFTGEDLREERTCYRITCPRRAHAPMLASDRFGAREIRVRRAARICVPSSAP
jgi:hypothetical protein